MKLKLDENLGRREAELLRAAGHDVTTVVEQNVCSAADIELITLCGKESRCLVTLDLDFGNPLLFKPSQYRGIAVLRLPSKIRPQDIRDGMNTLIQRGRVRIYQEE